MDKLKVSAYIRVSTGRQAREGDSLEEQESELKKFCEYKNYLIHKMHIERGRSAKDTNRPEYQKLLEEIKEKKINTVVVKKLDRLSRSLLDFEDFMRIAQENDVEFISLKENFDTTNAMGKAMLRIALVFAQLEREQNSERVIDVMTYRAEQGLFNGGTNPFGYDLVNKELLPHKQERKAVEFMFNKFIDTKSTATVARELTAQGFMNRNNKPWHKRQVDYLLRNPIYTGKIQWNDSIYNGIHQPLITETLFNKVQEIFSNRKYYRDYKAIKGLFKGVLVCGSCGSAMIPNYTSKKNNQRYFYYRCTSTVNINSISNCQNKYIKMEDANKKIMEKILGLAEEKKLNKIEREVNKQNTKIKKSITVLKTELEGLENYLKTINSKKEKYIDALIANNYAVNERGIINSKIEGFSLEEKKTQSEIYKKEFTLSGLNDQVLSMYEFKKEMVFIKINHASLDSQALHEWIFRNIEQVIYGNDISIKFKLLNK